MMQHQSVLLSESIQALNIQANGFYIDATFGRGGHSRAILQQLNTQGRLIALDRDQSAIEYAKQQRIDTRLQVLLQPFSQLQAVCDHLDMIGKVNGVLFDLGVSSPQLDQAERGFSFVKDGPLDMRMDGTQLETAATWLNQVSEWELVGVLRQYGEEPYAKRIAKAIIQARQQNPLSSTLQLAEIIKQVYPKHKSLKKHPATLSFQAIRIYINQELSQLKLGLEQALNILCPQGRLAVISFHSLEDRIVKQFLQQQQQGGDFPPDLPVTADQFQPTLKIIGKIQKPSSQEVAINLRARSAKLRVAEKL